MLISDKLHDFLSSKLNIEVDTVEIVTHYYDNRVCLKVNEKEYTFETTKDEDNEILLNLIETVLEDCNVDEIVENCYKTAVKTDYKNLKDIKSKEQFKELLKEYSQIYSICYNYVNYIGTFIQWTDYEATDGGWIRTGLELDYSLTGKELVIATQQNLIQRFKVIDFKNFKYFIDDVGLNFVCFEKSEENTLGGEHTLTIFTFRKEIDFEEEISDCDGQCEPN